MFATAVVVGFCSLGGAAVTDTRIEFETPPSALASYASSEFALDADVSLAVSDDGATVVAVWASTYSLGGTIGNDNDILRARSTDGGLTWSAPAKLNSNAGIDSNADTSPR